MGHKVINNKDPGTVAVPQTKMMKVTKMVGGIPRTRMVKVGDSEDHRYFGTWDIARPPQELIGTGFLPAVGFVPKKDFGHGKAKLEDISPPLQYLDYEPAPKHFSHMTERELEAGYILSREFKMPPPAYWHGKDSEKWQQKIAAGTKHKRTWNPEVVNAKTWAETKNIGFRKDGRLHEFRSLDRFVKPKEWRLLHPEEYEGKKDMVLKLLEDQRRMQEQRAIANAAYSKPPSARSRSAKSARSGRGSARATLSTAAAAQQLAAAGAAAGPVFMTQATDGEGALGASADEGDAAPAASSRKTLADVVLAAADAGGKPLKLDETGRALPFQHGTSSKWSKFKSSTWRKRPKVKTPAALTVKPKFDPSRYLQAAQEKVPSEALATTKMYESGTYLTQLPVNERVLKPAARPKIKKQKKKVQFETQSTLRMLDDIVATEDRKLKALEGQLDIESEELKITGAAPYSLDPLRNGIQRLRRRIGDLREAHSYVRRPNWLDEIKRFTVSSPVPLEQFLRDAVKLTDDQKFLVGDKPW